MIKVTICGASGEGKTLVLLALREALAKIGNTSVQISGEENDRLLERAGRHMETIKPVRPLAVLIETKTPAREVSGGIDGGYGSPNREG